MRSRTALLAAVLILAVAGGVGAWLLFLRGDNVAPLALPSTNPTAVAVASPSSPSTTSSSPSAAGSSSRPDASTVTGAGDLAGTWTIGPDSVVGYRVRERLANLSADSDAVGRTEQITGTVTLAENGGDLTVTAADFSVDMTTIASDRSMRDNRLRTDGIETDSFPTSTFTLTAPVTVPTAGATGGQVDVTLHGDLTLHGVTKTIGIPAQAQLTAGQIQIAGSYAFPFSDFDINPPNVGGFVSVEDNGTLEFLVNLTKS
jgi:polyisoprenoid-binding protein YceI